MALVWDFAREIASGSPGNTTSYYDEWTQAFYTNSGYIVSQIGLLDDGQWQDLDREYEEIISDLGYGFLDVEHHFNGMVCGSAQHDSDVVFLKYSYMLDISPMVKKFTWQLQPDNPIKTGSIDIMNNDDELFADNTFSLFLPGNRILLRFYSGSSAPYDIGTFFIEDSPYAEKSNSFRYAGRNRIGFYLAAQALDEYTDYSGTLTEIFEDLLENAGITSFDYLIENTASTGTFSFKPTDNYMTAIMAALEISDWYMDDQANGKIVIGSAEFIRANAASTGIYTFHRGSDVFTHDVKRSLSNVYSRVCVNRNGSTPRRVYADVPYYTSWHVSGHRTFYQNVPDNTSDSDMNRIASDLSVMMQYSGINEEFDSPFRPWLQIGDVGYATGGDEPRLVGIITSIQHEGGEGGFFTQFSIMSGGEVVNPEDPETIEVRYLGRMGGANRPRRLLDYLTGNISSSTSAGSSPVGAVAYQAAVAGGYIGDEQTFNEFLADIAEGAVVPDGGTIGQVLTKQSNDDYDAVWSNVQEIENQNGGMLKIWAGTDDEFAAIPELETGIIWIVTQYDGSCLVYVS